MTTYPAFVVWSEFILDDERIGNQAEVVPRVADFPLNCRPFHVMDRNWVTFTVVSGKFRPDTTPIASYVTS